MCMCTPYLLIGFQLIVYTIDSDFFIPQRKLLEVLQRWRACFLKAKVLLILTSTKDSGTSPASLSHHMNRLDFNLATVYWVQYVWHLTNILWHPWMLQVIWKPASLECINHKGVKNTETVHMYMHNNVNSAGRV